MLAEDACKKFLGERDVNVFGCLVTEAIKLAQPTSQTVLFYWALKILLRAAQEGQSKADVEFAKKLELAAFFGLMAQDSIVRATAFDLLTITNDLQENGGFFSLLEDHLTAISADATRDILFDQFPERPERRAFPVGIFQFRDILVSSLADLWYFFLAGIARLLLAKAENAGSVPAANVHTGVEELRGRFRLDEIDPGFTKGLLVVMFASWDGEDSGWVNRTAKQWSVYPSGMRFTSPVAVPAALVIARQNCKKTTDEYGPGIARQHYNERPEAYGPVIAALYPVLQSID
jgi:hypothetical protein